ncbi:MAG: hypothetical protein KDC26_04790 [Armatimonadetes bacterium]|nr:hypothetical protein [Armatimonadota bacterium]
MDSIGASKPLELTPKLQQEIDRFRKYEKWADSRIIVFFQILMFALLPLGHYFKWAEFALLGVLAVSLTLAFMYRKAEKVRGEILEYFLLNCKEDTSFALSLVDDALNGEFGKALLLKQSDDNVLIDAAMLLPIGHRNQSLEVLIAEENQVTHLNEILKKYVDRKFSEGSLICMFLAILGLVAIFPTVTQMPASDTKIWVLIFAILAAIIGLMGSFLIPKSAREALQGEFNAAWNGLPSPLQAILKHDGRVSVFLSKREVKGG